MDKTNNMKTLSKTTSDRNQKFHQLKEIFFDDSRWKVEGVLTPNKGDVWLLVSQLSDTTAHEDGAGLVYYAVIDVFNETFVPVTPQTTPLLQKRNQAEKQIKDIDEKLDDIWSEFLGVGR